MTAPPAPDRVRAAHEAHDRADAAYDRHMRTCRLVCATGGWCREAWRLLDDADDAGKRWQIAEGGVRW